MSLNFLYPEGFGIPGTVTGRGQGAGGDEMRHLVFL